MSAIVQVKNLSHRYFTREHGERLALDNVSFEVREAEIFGFLGPNGGGKTTLFRILSTMLSPSHCDKIEIAGFDLLNSETHIRKRCGIVFQSPSLDKKLTVFENLKYQGHLYGLYGNALARRMDELLRRGGLQDRQKDRVEALSGGLKRRVEIAKALLHEPKLLFMDEPTTGLDPGARIDFWNYLKAIKGNGVTCLVTTHIMEEAEKCDQLGILHEGKLVVTGSPEELKTSIGKDILTIETKHAARLKHRIKQHFELETMLIDSTVRIEMEKGYEWVTKFKEAFPNEIDAITVSKPSLEDVFIKRTGHRFWEL